MAFPFTFKFTSIPNVSFGAEEYPIVLKYISNYLLKKNAKDIVIKNNILEFKVIYDTSNFNWTLPIDGGEITIINSDGYIVLVYDIFFYVSFFVYFVISLGAGISSKSTLFGCLIFIIIYCPFLLITFFKHKNRIKKITQAIEALINQK